MMCEPFDEIKQDEKRIFNYWGAKGFLFRKLVQKE